MIAQIRQREGIEYMRTVVASPHSSLGRFEKNDSLGSEWTRAAIEVHQHFRFLTLPLNLGA